MMVRYIDTRYPGSTHDAFVWNCTQLNTVLESWYQNGERCAMLGNLLSTNMFRYISKLKNILTHLR